MSEARTDPPQRPRLGPITFGILLLLPVASAALFLVWTRVTTLRLGYRLDRARSAFQSLAQERDRLRFEMQVKSSPQRLVTQCGGNRGLRPPTAEQVVETRAKGDAR